jgi:site-specific DNA recombinase
MEEFTDADEPERVDQRRLDRRRVIGELRDDTAPPARLAVDAVRPTSGRGRRAAPARANATAFIYVRVSTREQARTGGGEEGYSIRAQRTAATEKARQLGAEVAGIYIDAGESAKSARRPQLQQMLRDVAELHPDYVIVHKIDRLARNRADDIAINIALRKAGTQLVSCSEAITDTPSGKFLYNIMADMAQFYSDNLAQEVKKGLVAKAAEGGTPFKAPLGYLHRRDYRDGIQVSWVEIDPERGPLVRWAFAQYATGEWTSKKLLVALQDHASARPRNGPSAT